MGIGGTGVWGRGIRVNGGSGDSGVKRGKVRCEEE